MFGAARQPGWRSKSRLAPIKYSVPGHEYHGGSDQAVVRWLMGALTVRSLVATSILLRRRRGRRYLCQGGSVGLILRGLDCHSRMSRRLRYIVSSATHKFRQ